MLSTFAKAVTILLLAFGIGGAVLLPAAGEEPSRPAGNAGQASGEKKDVFGDPLPDGALARMGTLRWRHPGAMRYVGFAAQGKELVTACADGFYRAWELASGKEIRRFGANKQAANAGGEILVEIDGVAARMVLGGPGGPDLVLSPDGQILAARGNVGIVLWHVGTGKEMRTLQFDFRGKNLMFYGLTGLAFSPDGKSLAARGPDQSVHIWEVASGKELVKTGPPVPVKGPKQVAVIVGGRVPRGSTALAFSGDGNTLLAASVASANQKTTVALQVSDAKTGKELRQVKLPLDNGTPNFTTFAPDGKTMALGLTDGTVRFFENQTGKEVGRLGPQRLPGYMTSAVYSPDGKVLASSRSGNSGITLWDVSGRKELVTVGGSAPQGPAGGRAVLVLGGTMAGPASPTYAFAPDGKTLAEATAGNSIRLWNVASGKETSAAAPASWGHHGGISQLAVSPDAKVLVTSGTDGTVRRWDLASGKELGSMKLPGDSIRAVLSADGRTVVCGTNANKVRLLSVETGKEVRSIDLPPPQQGALRFGAVSSLALSADSKLLAVRGFDQVIRVFDAVSGKEVHHLREAAAAPDPRQAQLIAWLGGNYPGAASMVFSPNGRQLAMVGGAGPGMISIGGNVITAGQGQPASPSIRLWDLTQRRRPRAFDPRPGAILAQAFTPDGRNIVSANSDNTVSLWEALTGKECLQIKLGNAGAAAGQPIAGKAIRRVYNVAPSPTTVLAVAPNGRTLAVAGPDQAIRLWDLRSGKELGKFHGHTAAVLSLAFAPDSKTVISGSADTTALVWDGSRLIKEDTPPSRELTAKQVDDLWQDLAADPAKAYQAAIALRAAPKQAVPLFQARLKLAAGVDAKRIDQFIADLETTKFEIRQKATQELEKLGELAEPALRKALAKGPALETRRRLDALLEKIVNDKVPPPELLRSLRAVQVLEQTGTADARPMLERLAQGAPGHRLTRHAEAALKSCSES